MNPFFALILSIRRTALIAGSSPMPLTRSKTPWNPRIKSGGSTMDLEVPVSNSGRLCYGLDAPENEPVTEWAVFVPPTVDIPSTVQLGQTWSGSLYWLTIYYEILLVSNYYSFSASVDAYGTLVLPAIGAVPALRVHEIDTYRVSDVSDPPLLLDINTNQVHITGWFPESEWPRRFFCWETTSSAQPICPIPTLCNACTMPAISPMA